MRGETRMGRALATVGIWTMFSRILGFLRDILFAGFLGAGAVAEAFWIAFSLPNMFRRLFAEGALSVGFTPLFCEYLADKKRAETFASDILSVLAVGGVVLSAFAILFMPALVYAVAAGFGDDARFGLAVLLGRIAFAYILFISLATLFSAILQATGRFALAASMQLLLNISFIIALLVAYHTGWMMGKALTIAALFAGFFHMVILWRAVWRMGFRVKLTLPRLTPELRRFLTCAWPAILAGGVVQINLVVGRQVASFFDGAIAWLSYADRIYQLPLSVAGISVGVVLLPALSRQFGQKAHDRAAASATLSRAAEFSLALGIPAAVALFCVPEPLVGILFERGAFSATDTQKTAELLAIYALGLPAFMVSKVLQTVYFARKDTKRPFHYAVCAMVLNVVIALGFAPFIGYLSAAWASVLSAWALTGLLAFHLNRAEEAHIAHFDTRFFQRLWRIILASALMGGAISLGVIIFADMFLLAGWRYGALFLLVLAGIAIYGVLGSALGAFSFDEMRKNLKG